VGAIYFYDLLILCLFSLSPDDDDVFYFTGLTPSAEQPTVALDFDQGGPIYFRSAPRVSGGA
jgi:hypothetical protein